MKNREHGKVQKERRVFSSEFKRKVCAEYLHSECSMESLRRKYDIKGHSAISNWLRKFSDIEAQTNQKPPVMPSKAIKQKAGTDSAAENLQLKAQIKSLETDKLLLETMLEIVKEDYGIDARKKCAAGQLKK